jgi:hypothetical protein
MNRKLRRAARATPHKQPEKTIRIHEAGHCVARVLRIYRLGWQWDEVIEYTEIYPTPMGIGESQELLSTTFGKFLSKPMNDFWRARMPDRFAADATVNQCKLASMIPEMRAAGIDVDKWFTAKSIEAICGPMAEAKFLGKPVADVFDDYSSEADLDDVRRLDELCGKTLREAAEALAENVGIAYELIERPGMWRAVQAASQSFTYGRNDGRKTAKIILESLFASA